MTPQVDSSEIRILIADDDPVTRMLLRKSLESWGYVVFEANDGEEAAKIVEKTEGLQLFIIDWGMPNLNGIDFCRWIKHKDENFYYIIMLTSRKGTANVVEAMTAGVDDFISKPFVSDELRVRVKVGDRIIEQERRLSFYANRDSLTAVWNRRMILKLLKEEWERSVRENSPLSVALFDIDHFKSINDHYGHQVGDQALQYFCDIISEQIRPYDKFGRYGGEEFLLVLPGSDIDSSLKVIERCRKAIEQKAMPVDGHEPLVITVSVGVSESISGNKNVQVLFKECDKALYQAKNQGRNLVIPYVSKN